MAYHNTLSPTDVLNADINATRGVLGRVGRFFRSVLHSVTLSAIARARFETLTALQGKSDAELAQLGLAREDLVRHVFHDLYYS